MLRSLVSTLLLPALSLASQCTDGSKADFDAARAKWSAPACYDFVYEARSFSTDGVESVIEVRNGDGETSLDAIMDDIDSQCFAGCASNTAAAACKISYAIAGYPLSIFIDPTTGRVGEEAYIEIKGYKEVECPAGERSQPSQPRDVDPVAAVEGEVSSVMRYV